MTDKEKLNTLNHAVWNMGMYPERFELADSLEKEAMRQGNRMMQGNANYYKAECFYHIQQMHDSSLFYLDKAETLGFDKTQKHSFRLRFYNYLYNKKYLTALYYIEKYLEEESIEKKSEDEAIAHICLGSIYLKMGAYESAATAVNKALQILGNLKPTEPNHLLSYEALLLLVRVYNEGKKYDSAYQLIDTLYASFKTVKETELEFEKTDIERFETLMHVETARLYINVGELKKAKTLLDSLHTYIQKNPHDLEAAKALNYMRAMYYNKNKEFDKALEYIEKRMEEPTSEANMLRSEIAHHLNRDKEAYEILKSEILMRDSLLSKDIIAHLMELEMIYEVNQMKSEIDIKSIQLERNRIVIAAFILFSLLLLFITIYTIRNRREREKRNIYVYEQYRLLKTYLEKIRAKRDELQLTKEEVEEGSVNWAERAHHYLLETEAFKKEDLSRDDLALALGTNRQYLINSIKNETGQRFKDYINNIRLEYAYEMLITNRDASIESIYLAAGFKTRNTFNRLFKHQYGMNPMEMREAAKQKEEEIEKCEEHDE